MTAAPAPCPDPFNLADHMLRAGRATPDKIALEIVSPARSSPWSYARLTEAVGGAARLFRERGSVEGDRVLLRLGNQVEFPVAFLGAVAAGMVPVPVSAALTTPEMQAILDDLDPALILWNESLPLPASDAPRLSAGEVLAAGASDLEPVNGPHDRPAYIVYTSGTGGRPRAVLHAHRSLWARRSMVDGWYGLTPDDRVMHAGAFNWTFTLGTGLLDPWTMGATAVVPAEGTPTEALPLLMRRHQATIFAAAPGVYRRLVRTWPGGPVPSLRHGLTAGEKLPEATRAAWELATGTALHEAFGMSECSTFLSGSPARPAPPGTLGFPQLGRRVAVLDDDGSPAAPGSEGRLAVHAGDPGLALGYPGAEADWAARRVGEWFLTGDRAAMDAAGAVSYLGRDDDTITAGGYRVSPVEIEAAMLSFPGVDEAAAVEIRPSDAVSLIAGFYVSDSPLDETQLSGHISERLARHKCPRILIRLDALPRGANGKILRRDLRDARAADNDKA